MCGSATAQHVVGLLQHHFACLSIRCESWLPRHRAVETTCCHARRPEGPVAQRGIASRPPPSLHISSHAAPLALVLISNVITGLRVSHVRRIAYFALHRFYEKGFQTLMLAKVNGWVSVCWCRLAVLSCVCATCGPLFECCSLSIRWWITGTERWRCDIRKVEGGV